MPRLLIPSIITMIISLILAYFSPNDSTMFSIVLGGFSIFLGVFGIMGFVMSFIDPPQ